MQAIRASRKLEPFEAKESPLASPTRWLVAASLALYSKCLRAGLFRPLQVRGDDDHGHRGVVDDALAYRAQHHASEPPAPVAAHNDGVHSSLPGEPQKLPCGIVPEEELRIYVELGEDLAFGRPAERRLAGPAVFVALLAGGCFLVGVLLRPP